MEIYEVTRFHGQQPSAERQRAADGFAEQTLKAANERRGLRRALEAIDREKGLK